jgi:hypothetical protein
MMALLCIGVFVGLGAFLVYHHKMRRKRLYADREDHEMRHVIHSVLILCISLGVIPATLAEDRLSIRSILDHPAEYQAKVVSIEGTAKAITTIPVHRGAHRCGGSPVYDTQKFMLADESGTIEIGTAGTCQPNATQPVLENEHLRIRGVVVADEKDPHGSPVIYADAIDRITPPH